VTWCSSAVNRSFFRSFAACRTSSCHCRSNTSGIDSSSFWDTLSRFCARRVRCCLAFPSVPALGSICSAPGRPALFAGFFATMAESDFSRPYIIGFGSSPSRCGPVRYGNRPAERSPGSRARRLHACQDLRPRRTVGRWRERARTCCLPQFGVRRHPEFERFRGSMAGLHAPYRRFAVALTDDHARLGANVVRYIFIVVDFHYLHLAGLPAHPHDVLGPAHHQFFVTEVEGVFEVKQGCHEPDRQAWPACCTDASTSDLQACAKEIAVGCHLAWSVLAYKRRC
jgi:hypothetical protein